MNSSPERAIIEEVAQLKGISAAFVEKDWFVTQVIKLISLIRFEDFTMVFTGGTALSKAHGLIQRFSEDIDFRVLAPGLAGQSQSQQRRILSAFKKKVTDQLRTQFDVDDSQITARNGNRFFAVELNYPTLFARADALRPHILLELTVSDLLLPAIPLPVSSFIHQLAKRPAEVETIECIDLVENAIDKLSAITWRIPDRTRGTEGDDPAVVRHVHDLAILGEQSMKHPDFTRLVNAVMERDNSRSEVLTGLSVKEKLGNMIRILESDPEYGKEYVRFVHGMSYAPTGSVPTFEAALKRLHSLIDQINGI